MREHKTPKPEQRKLSDKLRRHSRNLHDRKLEWKERRRVQQFHHNRTRGSAPLRQSISLSFFEGDDDMRRERARVFRSWSGLFVVRWHKTTNTLKDTVTIQQPSLTWRSRHLRFDAGLIRNSSTELYHVLIMSTRGRAQRLVLKAAEPEERDAYRLHLRRYEPISTVQFRNLWMRWQPRSVVTSWIL